MASVNKKLDHITLTDDKKFRVDEKCDGCGLCVKVCPVGDIKLVDGKPVWLNKCLQCIACLSLCPQQAIQYLDTTKGRARYRNPDIPASEIITANEVGSPR